MKIPLLIFGGIVIIAGALFLLGYPIAAFVVIVIPVAMFINGFIAEVEDNEPGGFNNPTSPPQESELPKGKGKQPHI